MTATTEKEPLGRVGMIVSISVFIALVCDGMDLQMLSLSLPLLMKDFQLDKLAAGALSTWTLIGMLFGGILAGWMADRIGRAKVTTIGIIVFSVGTAALAFTHSFWQFAFIRFLSGFGLSAVYSVGTMLAAEYVPTSRRTTVLGILQAGWSIGYIVAALMSAMILPVYGWRPMFVLAILPGLVSIFMMRYVPEPPSFYATLEAKQQAKQQGKEQRSEYSMIFADKTTRNTFLFWGLASFMLQFGYYGANTCLPSYLVKDLGVDLKNMGWYIAGTYTAMVVGKVATGYLGDIVGRKTMWVLVGIGTAVSLPLIMHYASPANVATLLLIFGLFYGAPYALNATYMNESFPTSVRGTAVGTSYNLGRVGSAISPIFIGYVANQYSIAYGIALLGVAYAFTAIVPGLFIKEKMYDPKAVTVAGDKSSASL